MTSQNKTAATTYTSAQLTRLENRRRRADADRTAVQAAIDSVIERSRAGEFAPGEVAAELAPLMVQSIDTHFRYTQARDREDRAKARNAAAKQDAAMRLQAAAEQASTAEDAETQEPTEQETAKLAALYAQCLASHVSRQLPTHASRIREGKARAQARRQAAEQEQASDDE